MVAEIGKWAIVIVAIIAIIAIIIVAANGMGIAIPYWFITIGWIVLGAIIVGLAIKIIIKFISTTP